MKNYITVDPWKIIEEGFHNDYSEISESLFSIGNGMIGQRGMFEEGYSGDTLQGSYVAGIYYPDKTRVGWWKNGYPEYFAKVLNSCNWIGLHITVDGERLDLSNQKPTNFRRVLDMKHGILERSFEVQFGDSILQISAQRFCNYAQKEQGWIDYNILVKKGNPKLIIESYIDFDVRNRDSNYDEFFWSPSQSILKKNYAYLECSTKKTDFLVGVAMSTSLLVNDQDLGYSTDSLTDLYGSFSYEISAKSGDKIKINKLATIVSDFHHESRNLIPIAEKLHNSSFQNGFEYAKTSHQVTWEKKWKESDIMIQGDDAAQQGIRFNIFQLHQTYNGEDPRLNIGPKGFTGEKYGGSTYWDTEAYCLPFYMSTADQSVAKNLLVYRYKHLQKAIDNAKTLGFDHGAALYPMVTMDGDECHNEWEITFEEIHRNGAIAYAIQDYINYTGDDKYLLEYGIEVLVAISRFWKQRFNWSEDKEKYVMLGVTGPNEYENNVNNNWYTNYIAKWTLSYTLECLHTIKKDHSEDYTRLVNTTKLEKKEIHDWNAMIKDIYLPYDEKRKVYLQQDGFLDKELMNVDQLAEEHRPINQHWSWDRILRSCFIKQADVLQGFYFFEDDFSLSDHKRHFEFYEPMTVHESSLSPCVHSILACKIGEKEKAYEMYLRTARLDLDDYNNDTEDGLHITSMAGTWLSITKGFGGMRVKNGQLHFEPNIPANWEAFHFNIKFMETTLRVEIDHEKTNIKRLEGKEISVVIDGKSFNV